MEQIIAPVSRDLLIAELTPAKFFRKTNKGGNEIYVTTAKDSPNIMREIGRIRELSFRSAGGGTGKEVDIDEFDTMDKPYYQLFVWDPDNHEILGGYRFILGENVTLDAKGQPELATSEMFHFSQKFLDEYMPSTVELGRSFVHPDYQSSKLGAKSLFALDNLWDGLGALTVKFPQIKYCFGKVTVYKHYNAEARDLIFGFIRKHFADKENLIYPVEPFRIQFTPEQINARLTSDNYREDFKLLNKEVRALGVNIPPLVNAYLGLSPMMRSFGAAIFKSFGSVIEFAILIPVDQIYEEKKQRHIESYLNQISK